MAVVSKLLIDGDTVGYRAGFACEKTKYLAYNPGDALWTLYESAKEAKEDSRTIWSRKEVEPEDKALMLVSIILKDICERYPGLTPVIYLSPSVGNFRDVIATRAKYKGNRDGTAKPTHHKAIRNYLETRYAAETSVGQEADDSLGIAATEFPGSVIVSNDKDLLQVPGIHYNWVTKEEVIITPKQGAINFWTQVLTGDPVDNVPGIEGIGPKKAAKVLEGAKNNNELRTRVLLAYAELYGDPLGLQYFNETAALVWIRRQPGVNFA